MNLKATLVSMLLFGAGWVIISQNPPAAYEWIHMLGWISVAFGLIIAVFTIKEEITA